MCSVSVLWSAVCGCGNSWTYLLLYILYIPPPLFTVITCMDGISFQKHTSKHFKSNNYSPASKTPSGWRFAGGAIVARDWMLAGTCQLILEKMSLVHLDFNCTIV